MFMIGLPALLCARVQNILFLVLGLSGGDSTELLPSVQPPAHCQLTGPGLTPKLREEGWERDGKGMAATWQ